MHKSEREPRLHGVLAPLEIIKSRRNSIVLQGCQGTGYALLAAALATLHRNALRSTRGTETPLWE